MLEGMNPTTGSAPSPSGDDYVDSGVLDDGKKPSRWNKCRFRYPPYITSAKIWPCLTIFTIPIGGESRCAECLIGKRIAEDFLPKKAYFIEN